MIKPNNASILITTDWEYDIDFIRFLETSIQRNRCDSMVVQTDNLDKVVQEIETGKLSVLALIDRASDTSPVFIKLQSLLHESSIPIIDPIEQIRWVSDKATLHLEFLSAGILTPYTLILPPFDENNNPVMHVDDLAHLGRPFVIKPANTTGGGVGVVNGAESLQEVLHARKEFKSDKYLIQEKINPLEKEGYRFWFRSFYVGGPVFSTWWNEETHRYALIDDALIDPFGLITIPKLMQQIHQVAMLTFFSSEIACCEDGRWIVVDYVNESCDMRLQSKHWDGVPDALVEQIAQALVDSIFCNPQSVINNPP
ncbi:hypothetical protein ACFL4L_00950 [bacterium]